MSIKRAEFGTCDMEKRIVMGPYFKYNDEDDWFSTQVNEGSVRVIEGVLYYAVNDLEFFDATYDACTQREETSRRVTRWVSYEFSGPIG